MELGEIRELTFECCGEWGLNHVDRLLKLIETIGEDRKYDRQLVWIATHRMNLSSGSQGIVMDAIGEHGGAGDCSNIESTLLREADYLDLLGAIGIARYFAKEPRNLRRCVDAVKKRMRLFNHLTLPRSIEIVDRIVCQSVHAGEMARAYHRRFGIPFLGGEAQGG